MNAFKPVALLLAGLLAACASSSTAPVLITLPPAAMPLSAVPAVAGTPGSTPLLVVRRVGIPEYLVARRVRYRADTSTLAEWPNTFWAERIEIGVTREFVSALQQQLPGWLVCDTSCGNQVPGLTLQVDMVPMDYVRGAQKLQARARITLSGGALTQNVLKTQELAYEVPAGADTPQAQAQAMTELLRRTAAATAPLVLGAKP